jgi:putative ABC transport system permease protein
MMSLLRSLTFRYLLLRWERSLLVAASIALGVATLVSTRLLNQCVDAAAIDTTVPLDIADLYVENGEAGVDWTVFEELKDARIPGVQRVQPFVQSRVALPQINDQPAILFGLGLESLGASSGAGKSDLKVELTWIGNPPEFLGRGVAISRRLYEMRRARGIADSEPVEIMYTNKVERFKLVVVIDIAKDSPLAPYTNLVAMSVGNAAKLTRPSNDPAQIARINRVDVFVRERADTGDVKAQIENIVRGRARISTPEANRKSTEEITGGVKLILNLSSLGAIIVGLFLVYNAMSVTVAERRHDIGVMRSLGATRTQIAALFSVEAMILGAIGSLPAIPFGIWLAKLAISQFGDELTSVFLNPDSFQPKLSVTTGAIAVLAGMATALLAALIPVQQAAVDEPADAVRRAPSTKARWLRWTHRGACLALVGSGMATVALRDYFPPRIGSMIGMSLTLVGLQLAMPIMVGWLAWMMQPLFHWLLGVEARLAADNLIRSPGRTGVVMGALAAGVSLMFQTAGVSKSTEVPIRDWLNQVIRADAFIFRGNLASANNSMSPMEPDLREKLAALPGVERVVGLRFSRVEYGGTFILVIGIDAKDYKQAVRARNPEGLPALDLMEQLPDGDFTVVSDNFATKWGVREGESVTVRGPRGDITLRVLGIGRDYSWSRGTIFVDRSRCAQLFEDRRVDVFHVFFRPDADHDSTYEGVQTLSDQEHVLVQNRASVHLYLAGVIDRVFRVAYMQQIIVAIVAALGVVMSLLISVLQRRRELGLLRAVGATQPQVMKSVLAEAMLIGILGTILGVLMGLPMAWFLLRVVMIEESGFIFDVLFPWKEALGIAAISVFTATLAGLLPSIHAIRLNIPEAIAYE